MAHTVNVLMHVGGIFDAKHRSSALHWSKDEEESGSVYEEGE